jgi:hypothetical protein
MTPRAKNWLLDAIHTSGVPIMTHGIDTGNAGGYWADGDGLNAMAWTGDGLARFYGGWTRPDVRLR